MAASLGLGAGGYCSLSFRPALSSVLKALEGLEALERALSLSRTDCVMDLKAPWDPLGSKSQESTALP